MQLSSYSRYGLRALIRLGVLFLKNNKPVSVREIAVAENISLKYLENIFSILKKKNIVVARKGKSGGYILSRQPDKITVLEIIEALEGSLLPVECLANNLNCHAHNGVCAVHPVWAELNNTIKQTLEKKTLYTLIDTFLNNTSKPTENLFSLL